VHIPLLMPHIDRVRTGRLMVDGGDGYTVEPCVWPEHTPRDICYFDPIELLLTPDQAQTDPI
jgi:hypothetical protein